MHHPTHRNSLDSRLLATNQVDNLGPILCLSHSFYIILHFIVFFKFPVDYPVRCGAISCILCPVPPSCEPLLCAFTLPFICTTVRASILVIVAAITLPHRTLSTITFAI
ncbi:hypothetical protein P692DRAFT_20845243 [Suillus brevipes Sb2]|nr:hypothetical protein P692DRAFT_20845243 [Suillus brevipes Sb2]